MTDLLDVVRHVGPQAGGTASALEILLRVTVLLLAAMLVARALRRSSAALRHMIWTLSLVGTLLIPLCYCAFPAWQWAILPQRQQPASTSIAPIEKDTSTNAPPRFAYSPRPSDASASEPFEVPTTPPAVVTEHSTAILSPQPRWSWPVFLATLWASGTFLGLVWLGIGILGAWYVARHSQPATDARWCQILQQLLAPCGFRRPIAVRECPQVSVPMTWGLRRPVILVPAGSAAWSEETKRSVLLHELGHIRRGDCLVHLLGRLACVAYWFHPLVWLAARQLRKTSEQAADDMVLSSHVAPPDYAEHLVGIAGQMRGLHLFGHVALPMASSSDLEGRVLAILDSKRNHRSLKRKACYASITLAALLLIPCALLRLGYAENKRSPEMTAAVKNAPAATVGTSPPSQPQAATPSEPPPALLTAFGKVVDPAGKPVAGATVYLREWSTYRISEEPYEQIVNDILATIRTDAEGEFRFENVPARPLNDQWLKEIPWDVVVVARPYAIAWRHLDAAQQSKPWTITLAPEAKITGRVTDKQGRPIQNAEVRVNSINSLWSNASSGNFADPGKLDLLASRLAALGKTDADGKVTISGLPRDVLLTTSVKHDEFRSDFLYVATTHQPQPDIDVPRYSDGERKIQAKKVYAAAFFATLEPPLPRLVGRIMAADTKKPLPQTIVEAYRGGETMTGQDGRFILKEIRQSRCRLIVWVREGGDYLGRLLFVDVPKQKREVTVDVELARGEILSGMVADEQTGKGIAGVDVAYDTGLDINTATVGGPLPSSDKTDRDGRFRLAVPPGKGLVRILGPVRGYDLPRPHYWRQWEVNEEEAAFVKKVAVIAGKPTGPVKFTVHRVAAKEEEPLVRHADPLQWQRSPPRIVEGIVVDPDGKPVAGTEVGPSSWFRDSESEVHSVRTDHAGHFSFRLPPHAFPSELIIAIHKGRRLRGHLPLSNISQAEASKTLVEIRLANTGIITGRVVEGDRPIGGAEVQLEEFAPVKGKRGTLTATNSDWTKTDEHGRFEFPLVEASKKCELFVRIDGYTDGQSRGIVAVGQTLAVEPFSLMRLDRSVAGTIVDPDGNPVAGAMVQANMRSGQSINGAFLKRPTGKDGRFAIRGVPNVPLTIMAYIQRPYDPKDTRVHFSAYVEAEPGEMDVRIVLDPKLVRGKK